MRLIALATLIILGLCLAYARHLEPTAAPTASYNGRATFLGLNSLGDDAVAPYWLVVCRVEGQRVAFPANDGWIRRAVAELRPGQLVTLRYDLPTKSLPDNYAEYGPPALRAIAPIADAGQAAEADVATDQDAVAFNADRR